MYSGKKTVHCAFHRFVRFLFQFYYYYDYCLLVCFVHKFSCIPFVFFSSNATPFVLYCFARFFLYFCVGCCYSLYICVFNLIIIWNFPNHLQLITFILYNKALHVNFSFSKLINVYFSQNKKMFLKINYNIFSKQ